MSLQEKEPVKVFLRIRPLKNDETSFSYSLSDDRKVLKFEAPNKSSEFSFSSIYDGQTSQKDFFELTVLPLLEEFVTGLNCLVFTYGVTNSGKTYTLQGIPTDAGILPRTLDLVFSRISSHHNDVNPMPKNFNQFKDVSPLEVEKHEKLKQKLLHSSNAGVRNVLNETMISGASDQEVSMFCPSLPAQSCESTMSSIVEEPSRVLSDSSIYVSPGRHGTETSTPRYSIWVSFLEIYNEKITDLLAPSKQNNKPKCLKINEDLSGNTFVGELSEIKVNSAQEACQILAAGQQNLKYSATSLNQKSSRSHCIFNIKLAKLTDTGVKVSLFSFCDLAGSERQSKAKTSGVGMKETAKINASMLQLGQCLKQLRENCEKKQKDNKTFVPFRNSKLTHLFQNVLQGSGRAVMIVNIASDNKVTDETFNALKLSAVAQKISTNASLTTELPKIVPQTPAFVKKYRSAVGVPCSTKKCKLSFDKKEPLKEIQEEDNDAMEEMMDTSPEISSIHTDENGELSGLLYHTVSDDSDEEAEETEEEGEEDDSEESSEEDDEEDLEEWKARCMQLCRDLAEKKRIIRNLETLQDKSNDTMTKAMEYYECKLDKHREDSRKQKENIEKLNEELGEMKEKLAENQRKLEEKENEIENVRHEISIIAFDNTKESAAEEGTNAKSKKIEQLEATLFRSDELCAKLIDDKEALTQSFNEKIEKLEVEIARMASKEYDMLAEMDSQSSRIEKLEAEIEEKVKALEKSESLNTEMESERNILLEKVKEAESRASELEKKHDQEISELSTKNNHLFEAITVLQNEKGTLAGQLKQQTNKIQNSRKRSIARVSRGTSFMNETDSSELNISVEIDLMSRDVEALIDSQPVLKKDLKHRLVKKEEKIEEMKEALDKMNESIEEGQVSVVKANQILRRSNVLTASRERESEVNRAKKVKLSNELSLKKERIRELEDELEKLKEELTSQKNESKKQSEKIRELELSMEAYQVEISQLKEHDYENMKKTEEIQKLHKSMEQKLMEQSDSFSSQIDSLRKQNAELTSSLNKMTSSSSMSSKGGTLPKSSNVLSIATSMSDETADDAGGISPVQPIDKESIHQSTCFVEPVMEIVCSPAFVENSPKGSKRPPSVPRGKGRKVAAIRKNFESSVSRKSGTGLLSSKPVGKVGKASRAKRVTRGKRAPSGLSNVPENSILEILKTEDEKNTSDWEEEKPADKTESNYNLRRGVSKTTVNSGTCTTPSLDESTFYATGGFDELRALHNASVSLLTDDNTAAGSDTTNFSPKRKRRVVNKPTKAAVKLYKPSPLDNLDVTQNATDINNLVSCEVDSVCTRTRRKRVARN